MTDRGPRLLYRIAHAAAHSAGAVPDGDLVAPLRVSREAAVARERLRGR